MYDYYTTLDVLLSEKLEINGQDNILCAEVGRGTMTALLDLFVFPQGPRLRDRISHGVR